MVLVLIEVIRCAKCGNRDPIIPRVNDLMRLLALAVVAMPQKLAGEEVRFLRKSLKMSGDEFSSLIHVDKTTFSKWENNEQAIGDQSDRLIRAVTMVSGGVSEGGKIGGKRLRRHEPRETLRTPRRAGPAL